MTKEQKPLLKKYVELILKKKDMEKKIAVLTSYEKKISKLFNGNKYNSDVSEEIGNKMSKILYNYMITDGELDDVSHELKLHEIRFDLN